jgi:hypothetical protein
MLLVIKNNASHKKVWDDILLGVDSGAIPNLTLFLNKIHFFLLFFRKFLERVSEEFVCVVCQELASNPIATPCGHIFCKKPCFGFLLKSKEDSIWPNLN